MMSRTELKKLVSVLFGPVAMFLAAGLALTATLAVQSNDRAKDLMQFAGVVFGAGAAATSTGDRRDDDAKH